MRCHTSPAIYLQGPNGSNLCCKPCWFYWRSVSRTAFLRRGLVRFYMIMRRKLVSTKECWDESLCSRLTFCSECCLLGGSTYQRKHKLLLLLLARLRGSEALSEPVDVGSTVASGLNPGLSPSQRLGRSQ